MSSSTPPRRLARRLLPLLLVIVAPLAAARPAAECDRLALVLDPGLTPEVVQRDWATGAAHDETDAVIELRGCHGELLDRLELAAPMATLDPVRLRGMPFPTWLATADLTAPAGSTSGPLTVPVEVVAHRLRVARARGPGSAMAPIQLAATGQAAWRRVAAGRVDDLLEVRSERDGDDVVTTWRRYHLTPHGWRWTQRRAAGAWESDGDFPAAAAFP